MWQCTILRFIVDSEAAPSSRVKKKPCEAHKFFMRHFMRNRAHEFSSSRAAMVAGALFVLVLTRTSK